jgi:hypothetical protein
VVAWKACSAIARGETLALLAYMDKNVAGEASPGVALMQFSASIPLLRLAVTAAVGAMKVALDLYARRSG